MKFAVWVLAVVILLAAVAAPGNAAQRVVVAEDFTGTWCQYCPGAARGLDQLSAEVGDSLVVVAYHNSDAFTTTSCTARETYYGITGFPTVYFDGHDSVVGGSNGGTMYSYYRPIFNTHKTVISPLAMDLSITAYDPGTRTGTARIVARNTSASSQAGTLHFLVEERDIPYSWQGMTVLDFVNRGMLPSASGQAISLSAGDSVVATRSFTIGSGWEWGDCRLVSFVQKSDKTIIQACQLAHAYLVQTRKTLTDDTGAPATVFGPGANGRITIWVKDKWRAGGGAYVTAATADTFVTITNGRFDIGDMNAGDSTDNSASPFMFSVNPAATMPAGHQVPVLLTAKIFNPAVADTSVSIDTVHVLVGNSWAFFSDDFESGMSKWSVGGTGGSANWDTTSADYHSASHCLTDSRGGSYANSISRYCQMATPIDLRNCTAASLNWWERYDTQFGVDLCRPQASADGGTNWANLVPAYSGTQATWQKRSVDLAAYCGSAAAFTFRFLLSTNTSIVADGWYIDDVAIVGLMPAGVAGTPVIPGPAATRLGVCRPNPMSDRATFSYSLRDAQHVNLSVYDIAGQLVRTLVSARQPAGNHDVQWDGKNQQGKRISAGVYIYSLQAGVVRTNRKVTVLR